MKLERDPWTKFYWADWRADPKLRMCGLAARGLWMECLALMHEAIPYGHLLVNGKQPTYAQLGIMAGASEREVSKLLKELHDAGVPSVNEAGIWYSRRMVRDAHRRAVNRENGKGGGNPKLSDKPQEESRLTGSDNQTDKPGDKGSVKSHDARDLDARSQKLERNSPNPSGSPPSKAKGTRLGNDWNPDREDRDFCKQSLGWTDARISGEAEKFRDYWCDQPGSKGVKIRWHGTWRNWCRRARDNDAFNARTAPKPGRATAGERRNAILDSVADELVDSGNAPGGGGESGRGFGGGGPNASADTAEDVCGADGSTVRVLTFAAQGIAGDVAGTAGEVPAGRSETGLGSRPEHTQMGDPAEDRADGGSRGIRSVVSAPAHGQSHAGESHHAAGLGQEGSDAALLDIPDFLRRTA